MTKLHRSRRDKKILGICGGLAETLNVDATLLRLVVLVTAVFSAGTVLLLYVVAGFVIPADTAPPPNDQSYAGTAAPAPMKTEAADIDTLMRDVETKALRKEIEELKEKLAKIEKGEH